MTYAIVSRTPKSIARQNEILHWNIAVDLERVKRIAFRCNCTTTRAYILLWYYHRIRDIIATRRLYALCRSRPIVVIDHIIYRGGLAAKRVFLELQSIVSCVFIARLFLNASDWEKINVRFYFFCLWEIKIKLIVRRTSRLGLTVYESPVALFILFLYPPPSPPSFPRPPQDNNRYRLIRARIRTNGPRRYRAALLQRSTTETRNGVLITI